MPDQTIQNNIEVVHADEQLFPVVRQIALDTWPDTFSAILSKEQIDYMLDWMYSLVSLKRQVNELGHKFILAKENSSYLGFASYEINYQNQQKTKIHKIYILPGNQGKGIGKMLISEISRIALSQQNVILTLNVNRYNKATEVYKKIGFEMVGQEDIPIGKGFLMEDFVMEKRIG